VAILHRNVKSRGAFVAAAGFCSRCKQLRDDIGIPNPGCNKYRRFASVVALVDVTLDRNKLSDNIGVSVLGGGCR
jgi:hypothetical protein